MNEKQTIEAGNSLPPPLGWRKGGTMSMFKIVHQSGFPFVGYTFDDNGKLYCKTCGADSKLEHSSVCPQVGHWPTRKQIRTANTEVARESGEKRS